MNGAKQEVAFSNKRHELFALMLKKKGINATHKRVARRQTTDAPVPLSFAQQRLWFLDQLEPGNASYNMPMIVRLRGRLDVEVLTRTLSEIVRRHEVLRTTFTLIKDQPAQVIGPARTIRLSLTDVSESAESEREAEAMRIVLEEVRRPFELNHEPPLRASLLRLGEDEHIVILTMHHIISDGWSIGVLRREVEILYRAFSAGQASTLPELPLQYADYAVWQRECLQGEALQLQLDYWKQQLAGAPAVLELPTDRPRPLIQSFRGAHQSFALSSSLTLKLRALSRQQDVTMFMLLLGAFQILLMRYTGQEQISVGSPISGRNQVETEKLIGLFAYTLVLSTDLSGNPSLTDLLKRVRETALGAYAHQDVPFEKLVEELQPERSLTHSPLFQVMFILQNTPHREETALPNLRLEAVSAEDGTAKFDLTLSMMESDAGLKASWEYSTDLFDAETIRRMTGHLERLLEGIVRDPSQRISRLPLMLESERQQMSDWNRTQRDYDDQLSLHQLFEAQAGRAPDSIALRSADGHLTYSQLDARANQLSQHLRQLGVGPESRVAILLDRSFEMIIALLAVLKAGCVYLPLDPSSPRERLSWMMEDAAAVLLLTEQRYMEDLPQHSAQLVCLDSERAAIARLSVERPAVNVFADNLAYVMYTSGSTGKPKGVSITHRGVARLVQQSNYASLGPTEIFLQLAPISFDASTFEIWGSLLNGAQLVLMPPHQPSLEELGRALQQYGVTVLWLTAGLFHLMVDHRLEDLKAVRQVLAGGDVLSVAHTEKFLASAHGARLINGYGPTENTTFTCCYGMSEPQELTGSVPIGRPVTNTQVYILDQYLEQVVPGVTGELYTGGDGLARGYYNRPELTAERFIPNSFSVEAGARLYRTGDLVRYRAGGEIEYLGRSDDQVKVRGFRIELGEIEAALSQHPSVREALVIAREDGIGEKRLVAYLVLTEDGGAQSISELREYLKKQLPEYMLPTAFVLLSEMPLTPNGKINRRALPAPDDSRGELEKDYVAPRTELEREVAAIWQEVLGVERVGVYDNFFELGGHSLLATQVMSRVRESLRVEVALRSLFETPTVEGLAQAVGASQTVQTESGRNVIKKIDRGTNENMLLRLDDLSDEEVESLFPNILADLKDTDEQ
jgi:amino acid adenylation domain-containing protein